MKRQQLHPDVEAIYNRRLSAEELARLLSTPISAEEVASTMELVRWFSRRYPTAKERFAYVRRAYARVVARSGIALKPLARS